MTTHGANALRQTRRYTVLLCGNIASGKSMAGALLRSYGATIIDLDQIGQDLLDDDQELQAALAHRFGIDIMQSNRINRKLLAQRAFADDQAAADLNVLTHPRIYKRLVEKLSSLPAEARVVIVECSAGQALGTFAPLADEVLVITAPEELRRERAVARGMSVADVEARVKIQPTDEELVAQADTIIENRSSQAEFVDQLSQWFERIQSRLGMSG